MRAEMGNEDHSFDLVRLDHRYRAMMLRWPIGRNLEIGMRGRENEKDTRACERMSYGKSISPYIWINGVLAGLISCLYSFEAFRCIGWSVSVVYKVRDHEIGNRMVMEGLPGGRREWVGWVYLPTFPFGPGKCSLYRG